MGDGQEKYVCSNGRYLFFRRSVRLGKDLLLAVDDPRQPPAERTGLPLGLAELGGFVAAERTASAGLASEGDQIAVAQRIHSGQGFSLGAVRTKERAERWSGQDRCPARSFKGWQGLSVVSLPATREW